MAQLAELLDGAMSPIPCLIVPHFHMPVLNPLETSERKHALTLLCLAQFEVIFIASQSSLL